MIRRLTIVVAAAATLAACGNLPQPFRHEDGAVSALARPKLERGLSLAPLPPIADAEMLATEILKAFEDREIPVSRSSGPGFGRVIQAQTGPNGLIWRLLQADGGEIIQSRHPIPGTDAAMRRQAAQIADLFAAHLDDPDAMPQIAKGETAPPPAALRVQLLKGLPGDGDETLNAAMAKALKRMGVKIDAQAPFTLVGVVAVESAGVNEDRMSVSWLIKEGGADGKQLAAVNQAGLVPKGRLNLPWGGLARDIAEGGASAAAQVIRMAMRERAGPKPPPEPEPPPAPPEPALEQAPKPQPPAPQTPPPADPHIPDEFRVQVGPKTFTDAGPADIGKPDSNEQNEQARTSPQPALTSPAPMAGPMVEAPPSTSPTTKAAPAKTKAEPAKTSKTTKTSSKTGKTDRVKTKKNQPASSKPRTKTDR